MAESYNKDKEVRTMTRKMIWLIGASVGLITIFSMRAIAPDLSGILQIGTGIAIAGVVSFAIGLFFERNNKS
ncbi:MAG: hypothetical protein COA60_003190 [Robiginitomaculum sp.]|nr:hypothetical protein [Robiginitomaculum sp.]